MTLVGLSSRSLRPCLACVRLSQARTLVTPSRKVDRLSHSFPSARTPLQKLICKPRAKRKASTVSTIVDQDKDEPFRRARWKKLRLARWIALGISVGAFAVVLTYVDPSKAAIALVRFSRVGYAVAHCIIDYKLLFRKTWPGEEDSTSEEGKRARDQRHQDYSDCHRRCAERILRVLRKNGGIYVKLGQHLSSVQLIPIEWSSTMRPLQDQCAPTAYDDLAEMIQHETGRPIDELFSEFEREPIGVASLAQVHRATDRETGRRVAVKVMHPGLETFAEIDMDTTTLMLGFVKRVFPTFEFSWLGEEMHQNLPKEMDFVHEADNAMKCRADFAYLRKTALIVPDVLWAKKRILVMEYISGGRVDDLKYLRDHNIDRDRVSQQLSTIFSQMVYLHGFFHGDPHAGNVLIRPAQRGSRSPYNFELCLLDHGLYFDVDKELRTNYARLWLSFFAPNTASVRDERRKYAKLVGNISDADYPIFESAITGRASMDEQKSGREGSFLQMGEQSAEEAHRIRTAVAEQEGLLEQIFAMLRGAPRRVLMILKLNDLTRSLDAALQTTHPPFRVWLVAAHYCCIAVWRDDTDKLRQRHGSFKEWFTTAFTFASWEATLYLAAWASDIFATLNRLQRKLQGSYHAL